MQYTHIDNTMRQHCTTITTATTHIDHFCSRQRGCEAEVGEGLGEVVRWGVDDASWPRRRWRCGARHERQHV